MPVRWSKLCEVFELRKLLGNIVAKEEGIRLGGKGAGFRSWMP